MQLIEAGVTYADGTSALSNISLSLTAQEQVALIGPSGSGKSTLLRVLSMALAPTSGSVQFDSLDPWRLSASRLHRLRRKIHLCPQSAPLPARQRVVLAVLAGLLPVRSQLFALKSLIYPARADVALAHELLGRLGVEQHLWRPVEMLSGGQRQRVAIARAMASQSQFLYIDEPLSALDPSSSEASLLTLLQHATENRQAIVCSLHQVDLARRHLGRIIGLRQGKILFDCQASEVSEGMIDELYRGYEAELES